MADATTAIAYTWNELEKDQPLALLERRRVIGEKAMISHVTLRKGCAVPTHHHENEQFACILSGRIRFRIGPEDSPQRTEHLLGPGQVMHFPSNVPHAAEALEDTLVLDIFSPPSETTGIDRK